MIIDEFLPPYLKCLKYFKNKCLKKLDLWCLWLQFVWCGALWLLAKKENRRSEAWFASFRSRTFNLCLPFGATSLESKPGWEQHDTLKPKSLTSHFWDVMPEIFAAMSLFQARWKKNWYSEILVQLKFHLANSSTWHFLFYFRTLYRSWHWITKINWKMITQEHS